MKKNLRLMIFDDGGGSWGPLTDLRAAFSVRTGAWDNRRRIEIQLGRRATDLHVAPHHVACYRDQESTARVNQPLDPGAPILAVNGRWSGGPGEVHRQLNALMPGEAVWQRDGRVLAALLTARHAQSFADRGFISLPGDTKGRTLEGRLLLDRPWHIQDELETLLRYDLSRSTVPKVSRPPRGAVCFGKHPLRVGSGAVIQPSAVFNTEQGPIVIDADALIGAQSVLEGPCYIGQASQVTCHTHIRPHTVIGPMCKIGGEVSHSIVFGHTNKAHRGYLGNALVGEWVNLGAETNVSNLKNTYGQVKMQLEADQPAEPTGRTYLGPIIGDYVRTAIGTRLLTGACVGTGAMLAVSGFAPKLVKRFAFLTDEGGGQRQDLERFLQTAQRIMSRRGFTLSPAETERLRRLHAGRLE